MPSASARFPVARWLAAAPPFAGVLAALALAFAAAAPARGQAFAPGELHVLGNLGTAPAVFAVAADGSILSEFPLDGLLDDPFEMSFGPDGRLYVAGLLDHKIVVLGPAGELLDTIDLPLRDLPTALGFGPDGRLLAIIIAAQDMLVISPAGDVVGTIELPAGGYGNAGQFTFSPDGLLLVADELGGVVREIDPVTGLELRVLGDGVLEEPRDVLLLPDGRLLVNDADRLVILDPDGTFLTGPETDGPGFLSVALGPDGLLHVSVNGSGPVLLFDLDLDAAGTLEIDGVESTNALAFAPWRFAAKLKSEVGRADAPAAKVSESGAVLSLVPGTGRVWLTLADAPNQPGDLASLFGQQTLVLHGFAGFEDEAATVRMFHGSQVPDEALGSGVASLVLRVTGKFTEGRFLPRKARGTLHRAGAAGVVSTTVKTGKLLD